MEAAEKEHACRTTRRLALGGMLASLAVRSTPGQAAALALPRRITIITPYGPGSAPDFAARTLSDLLSRVIGVPTVVENRLGASGNIGNLAVARATPDGETLLLAASPLATNVSLFRSLGYDPLTSFEPIIEASQVGFALVVNRTAGATIGEFLERARRTGTLRYGSAGIGTVLHLGMEILRRKAGFQATHIPYRSSGEVIPDLVAGRIDALMAPVSTAVNAARDERLVVLASAADERLPYAPDVPTFAEAGISDFRISDWQGLCAPAGTPPAMLEALNGQLEAAIRAPGVVAHLATFGMTPVGGGRQVLRERLVRDIPYWASVIREIGIEPN
ncbi:Bug family tripartite tricarboxylate transporter substrate binding protein [Muricoccus aerilatus]|uniref:Bug family tripartite tricarboxylate transporter substrate binding protein n=1 Tax=Muricoccus aerilatus TaxID=452982 RepID=UPI00069325B0|nr:tripartite tricarboxylate transporter substrate-binding protein [Roseomonas aerilata]